ncbi:putative serine/threonine-protein kinase haspin [Chionoecetes opilio]|uniref:non-specific serine/threonine protein kinase n=1 Tax=Chionoecetes opilio TaxID=41210 RepID=A0A8J5CH99_CHIOP|nr:putative serine/threonine-protein kinase haspin [Chionoecetes opilio]
MELSGLRAPERQYSMTENFVHVQGSWCVEGRYPQDLLHLWDLYKEEKGSENDRPDMFPDTQLYIVLEFGHGGRDLESFVFNNARDLMAVFVQIAYSLAVAEEALEFEHRDLHWGNVLVAPTTESKIDFKLGGETYTLNTHGLKATVIDFTLSRIKLPHCIVFNNLAEDPSLFTSEGDYQFEVYRQMQHTNNDKWETFKPYTNVLWLHYLLVKMSSECYIKNNKTKLHRAHLPLLTKMRDAMLGHESATRFVLNRES